MDEIFLHYEENSTKGFNNIQSPKYSENDIDSLTKAEFPNLMALISWPTLGAPKKQPADTSLSQSTNTTSLTHIYK